MGKSRAVKKFSRRHPLFESLEERQLLSLTVDVRLAGGGTTADITSVGQVINMQVFATSTGQNATGTDEGMQDLVGTFISQNVSFGAALGTLQATATAPFNGSGSGSGTATDLDSDGDLDVGITGAPINGTDYFRSRSPSMTTSGGTVLSNGQSWQVASLTFTVTKLLSGSTTNIVFAPEDPKLGFTQVWREDGATQHVGSTGTPQGDFNVGTSVTLNRAVGTIVGKVYDDVDRDGLANHSDTALSDWQVYIDANVNSQLDATEQSVRSRTNGIFVIPNVPAGKYTVRVVQQSGFDPIIPVARRVVTLAKGQDVTGQNFGLAAVVAPQPASITGLVFNDKNGNGIKDGKDTRLHRWQVYLDANENGKLDAGDTSVRTRGSGIYVIPDVTPGTYRVRVNVQDGFRQISPGGYRLVTIATNQQVTGKNFAESPLALISGNVFNDANGNGTLDTGEDGLAYWRVFADVNGDGVFSNKTDRGIMTDASGKFAMGILPGGTWNMFASVPPGYTLTTPASGSTLVTVVNGEKKTGLLFGIKKIA